jgi:glycosyltransferase involved in cell wall biosynthesis
MKKGNLKVLMFGWEFPPFNSGGLGTACFGLTRSLSRLGVDIIFVLPKKLDVRPGYMQMRFPEKEGKELWKKKLNFREIDAFLYPYVVEKEYQSKFFCRRKTKGKPGIYAEGLYEEVFRYAGLAGKLAEKENFDVIHAHDWLAFPAGMEAKRVSGKKLVVHVHATEFDRTGGEGVNEQVYAIEKEGMEKADKIVAVSGYTKNIIISRYGISPEKVEVIHNGIDADYFQEKQDLKNRFRALKKSGKRVILFLGRITLQKGPDYFIRAAKIVSRHEPKAIFLVAGSGDMERRMMELSAELGISDKVLFAGFLRGNDLQEIYQAADLYVMPSISEPFGITALESMLCGVPVIVSKQSGVSEAARNVIKVDFWDVEDISDKILASLRYSALRQCLSKEGKKEVFFINWARAAEKCVSLYRDLVAV